LQKELPSHETFTNANALDVS